MIMGYSYDITGKLCCDCCGEVGKVRKRTCPHRVYYAGGGSLPYCSPSALCPTCYQKHKAALHEGCKERADERTREEAEKAKRLAGGAYETRTVFGDWHEDCPKGWVLVVFTNRCGAEKHCLIPDSFYNPTDYPFLEDYPEGVAVPVESDAPITKQVNF